MSSFVVYHTINTGPGYFLTGAEAEGFSGEYRLAQATNFKSKDASREGCPNYGALGTEVTSCGRPANPIVNSSSTKHISLWPVQKKVDGSYRK